MLRSSLSSQRLAVIFSPPLFISVLALCAIAFVVRLVVTQSLTSGRSCLLSLCLILACEVGAFSFALQLHFCDLNGNVNMVLSIAEILRCLQIFIGFFI